MAAVRYSFSSDKVHAELKHLATISRYQKGHGVGSRLLKIVENDAVAHGAETLNLRSYSNAFGFYNKFGYTNPSMHDSMEFEKNLVKP